MKEIASIQRRFCAYLIDMLVLLIPNLLIILLLKDFPLILDLSHMCVNCSYFTYFISSAAQATPGQQLMNIHIIRLDSSKLDLSLAFDRSISQFFLHLLKNAIIILVGLFQEQGALVSVFNILVVVMVVVTEYLFVLCWYLNIKHYLFVP
ncbi:RDD family protein, partial [Wolbachia endosymbiont of Atemnus politus]|uniref:RDD family protein n=1 Tax=Wolbachia endosymbiont of Atemnus politus TaxID=2682840 RepID=UPI0015736CF9